MAHEHDIAEGELVTDVKHVFRVPLQRGVSPRVVGPDVRAARTDVIEQHDPILVGESGPDVSPHVLITAKAMGKQHRRPILAATQHNIVTPN
jgi:hypothetical protein